MVLKLFDAADADTDDISKIEIDQEYAHRYEHNKKREDLHRFQELQKKGVIDGSSSSSDSEDSSSSDEDSDNREEIGPSKEDLELFDALIKVKNKDPILKEKDVKLFKSNDESGSEDGEDEGISESKKKKMYLKDVTARHLIEAGPEFDDDDDRGTTSREKTYNEEQEELRSAFLKAVETLEGDGEDRDFLIVKKREDAGENGDGDTLEFQKKLNQYFGEEDLDKDKMFLRDYFLKKMWIEKDKNKTNIDEDELDELLMDEDALEKQEDYETNFRHEELEDDRVMGYSRKVEGSVRQKETARARQRQRKEERMKIAEMERKQELRHLKNLKKQEINEKLKKFKQIAGIADDDDCPLGGDDLDDEFDPEEYDRIMKKLFNEKYYEAEDMDPDFGSDRDEGGDIKKPDFEKEDELLGLPKGWDGSGSGDGFLAVRERVLKKKAEIGDDDQNDCIGYDADGAGDDDTDEETVASEDGKRKRKRKPSVVQRAKEALMEEYYKLDYEDTIGDVKTRFKYAKTKPNRYGLSTAEILMLDDKELNQYVSLKKITPYREKEWKVPNSQRLQLKVKKTETLEAGSSKKHKYNEKKRPHDEPGMLAMAVDAGEGSETAKLSKKAKRRRRQAELKPTQGRLLIYGKVSSKSKGKSKGKSKK
ncbi:hypothetical protein SAY87_007661 [Trapa incisa]|uniref:Kri1-like C-terminal domain-containing protein n=1 Tax=Trapa incisa TaxID=236973 RepID=A0AAN7KIX8_9MYRT|nr:hypothetical protein SAY87_007661 [Trapa incisa]